MKTTKEYNKSYYESNKEKLRQKQKEHREKNIEKYKERDKLYHQQNKEKHKERDKLYHQQNKEKIAQQQKQHYLNNKEIFSKRNKRAYQNQTEDQKQKRVQSTKKFIENNKELVNQRNLEYYYKNKDKVLEKQMNYLKNKYKTDPLYRLRIILSSTITKHLKKANANKSKSSLEIVGLENWNSLKEHIEKQFTEGMNWTNHGNKVGCWSIDHILPISSAITEDEIYKLNHYTNLQPMWHIDNIKKSNNI